MTYDLLPPSSIEKVYPYIGGNVLPGRGTTGTLHSSFFLESAAHLFLLDFGLFEMQRIPQFP